VTPEAVAATNRSAPLDELERIDLTDHDAFVEAVPYEWFDTLRRHDPVHWQDERDGRGFWAVSAHADVLRISRDWETFSSQTGASAIEDLDDEALVARRSMIDSDPPLHTELRTIVSPPFRPRRLHSYEETVRGIAGEVIADVVDLPRFDLVDRIATTIPIKVLCRLIGVPEADEGLMIRLGDAMIANTDPDLTSVVFDSPASEAHRLLPFRNPAALEMYDYSRRLTQTRRDNPQEDLFTGLVHGSVRGQPIEQREIDAMFLLLIVAGNETTRQAIALSVLALLENPDQVTLLAAGDDGVWRTAIEELLRWSTPLHHFRRTATRRTTVGDKDVEPGDKLVVWYTSANRDEQVFADPYRLDLRRNPNPHTTFGSAGSVHRCLGEHLARLELRVVLQVLLPILPRLELDGGPVRIRSNFTNGLKKLPVRLR
jgi:cytochrome P450